MSTFRQAGASRPTSANYTQPVDIKIQTGKRPVQEIPDAIHVCRILSVTETTPELAVVVLSVGSPPELTAALESLKRQPVPLEIVIVNSGGGDPHYRLPENGAGMKVISMSELLWAGAARNAGIRESRAPWVAFMASDCIAQKNWATNRLKLHQRGHPAVACAVVNSHPRNLYAWASHISTFIRRLPAVPHQEVILYGASYSRSLFERYGEFREDLRIGEDTDFNNRLSCSDRPVWAPSVQTVHLNPTTFRHMVKSQFARGRRSGLYWPQGKKESLLVRTHRKFTRFVSLSYKSVRGLDRYFVISCWPLLFVCTLAYELGIGAGLRERTAHGSGEKNNGWFIRKFR